ncbi:hypothetical protein N9L68_04375 [bacterium]|nr:hypothetical protein [bacterium]
MEGHMSPEPIANMQSICSAAERGVGAAKTEVFAVPGGPVVPEAVPGGVSRIIGCHQDGHQLDGLHITVPPCHLDEGRNAFKQTR